MWILFYWIHLPSCWKLVVVWETTVRLMALGWSAAFPLLVGALCMMLGLSFGHIFGLDHFYIPGLFEGFNKSLLISMWTIYDNFGIPNGQSHNFRVSATRTAWWPRWTPIFAATGWRSAVSVSWESPPWGRRSSRFCAEPFTEQQHQSNHCDLVLLPVNQEKVHGVIEALYTISHKK